MRRYWIVSLHTCPSLISPLWINLRTLHLQLWKGPIRGYLRCISQGHNKVLLLLPHKPLFSAMKWHPHLINCESWNFAQETPFLCTWQWLNCTAMQFHSPQRWEEKGAGEGLRLPAVRGWARRWRQFPCDIMGSCWMGLQHRVSSMHWGPVVRWHRGGPIGVQKLVWCVPEVNGPSQTFYTGPKQMSG